MTPIRRQYLSIKQRYPNAILLFRLGDFYETFDEDAKIAAQELDIVLTSRSMGKDIRTPMAGIPAHAVESYLAKLIKAGHRVAICEQLSSQASSNGLVDRNVVRVVTPGTVVEPSMLEQEANNYLAAVVVEGDAAGLAYVDITTGEFAAAQLSMDSLAAEVARLAPSELLAPEGSPDLSELKTEMVVSRPANEFHAARARETLLSRFQVLTLEGFGCEGLPLATGAAGAVLEYLAYTQPAALDQIAGLQTYSVNSYMVLDPQTVRNLELFDAGRWGSGGVSLLSVLDFTRTAMGARLLRRWLGRPLLQLAELDRRLDATAFFHDGLLLRQQVRGCLAKVADVERILGRARLDRATPRDLVALKDSLRAASALYEQVREEDEAVGWLRGRLRPQDALADFLDGAVVDDPSTAVGEGGVIREGFSADLDGLRGEVSGGREYIARLERRERNATGIRSLKIGYNRVFGYYIEVSRSNLGQVPDSYTRRQTLANGERYVTPELKEYESRILSAQERIKEMELELFRQVNGQICQQAGEVMTLAHGLALVDVFCSLAEAAHVHGYTRPALSEDGPLEVKNGRHPMAERLLPPGSFVPNDLYVSTDEAQVLVITGPNMSGKSTFIRQAAIIALMAQIGSFVPAESVSLGLVDRIFTRVGLQDDLAAGQSTFMVEMVETAAILNQATRRSLVILDEIGRGTSTYDGLSIARAVAEHLHNHPRLGCRTLFATHYHELTQLADKLPRALNYSVAVSEAGGRLVFLHRIVPGGADRSYGVHVAQLAGLPQTVVRRAWEILEALESLPPGGRGAPPGGNGAREQLSLFPLNSPLLEELLRLDVTNMTPLEAINKLYELQSMAGEGP